MNSSKYLRIYLQDHLAGAEGGRELAKRTLSSNSQTPLGDFLGQLVTEIDQDIASLKQVMTRFSVPEDRFKRAAAWTAEKVGRLKLNGQLTGYSALSRLVELEGLCLGVEGKLSLWRSLKQALGSDTRLAQIDFDLLIERAQGQRQVLEEHRLEAARSALEGART